MTKKYNKNKYKFKKIKHNKGKTKKRTKSRYTRKNKRHVGAGDNKQLYENIYTFRREVIQKIHKIAQAQGKNSNKLILL